MPPFRLDRIRFRAGPRHGDAGTEVAVGRVTVLVGPNNSGKSQTLQEFQQWAVHQQQPPAPWPGSVILAAVEADLPTDPAAVRSYLGPRIWREEPDGHLHVRAFPLHGLAPTAGSVAIDLRPEGHLNAETLRATVMPHCMVSLDGKSRFQLVEARPLGPLTEPPTSHWMALERNPDLLAEVDRMVHAAFNQHLAITMLNPPQLVPALSASPQVEGLLQSTNEASIAFQQAAVPLQAQSDGVQVYVGLVSAIRALPHTLILIDEPEAFLHPTLATRLGQNLARISSEREANVIAATHSAEFLLGCVTEVPDTTVIRLTYRNGIATARALPGTEVAELTRNPLLRSAQALRALFAEAAVVCEADSDRAFYNEINDRLVDADGRVGSPDTIFLNAQNWNTIVTIAAPLRRAGIPAAVVLDFDAIVSDNTWPELWQMAGLHGTQRDDLSSKRTELRDKSKAIGRVAHENSPWKVKLHGVAAFDEGDRRFAEEVLSELAAVGIFVVPVGELEKWVPQFGFTNKQTWVVDMLTALGSRGSDTYVPPGAGDVWGFVESIARWTIDPDRDGIP